MNNFAKFKIVFKKEILFLLRDRKSIITNTVLTVCITPLLFFSLNIISNIQKEEVEKSDIVIGVSKENLNNDFVMIIDGQPKLVIKEVSDKTEEIKNGNIKGFLEITNEEGVEKIKYIFDERSNVSAGAVAIIKAFADNYANLKRSEVLQNFDLTESQLNPVAFTQESIQKVNNETSQSELILFILPYIILVALVQGSMQYAIEMTSGEKERNTLATTLLMNVDTIYVALAKISTTLVFSLYSVILNTLSIIIGFQFMPQEGAQNIVLTPIMVLEIFLISIPLSFLTSSLMIALGIYARNQKEAGIYATPLILSSVLIGFMGNTFDINTPTYVYAIPVLGHVAAFKQILQGTFMPLNILLLITSTLIGFILIVFLTLRMFKREEVLFRQ